MGDLLQFPRRFHVRTSADSEAGAALNPKSVGSASLSPSASALQKIWNNPAGNLPRDFQLLTADSPTPASPAVAVGPPSASMTDSTDLSMITPREYSQTVNLSSLHASAVEMGCDVVMIPAMAQSTKTIARRLKSTREAIDVTAADLCRAIDCKPNRWSQYEGGDRPVTLPVAIRLCEVYGLTLDWIYRGDPEGLPARLHSKLAKTAAA